MLIRDSGSGMTGVGGLARKFEGAKRSTLGVKLVHGVWSESLKV